MPDIFQISHAIGFILGLLLFPAILTGIVYLVCRLFGRKLVRTQVKSVYVVSFLVFSLFAIAGLFVD